MPYFKIYCSSSNVDDYRCTWSKLLFTIRAISKFYVAIFKKIEKFMWHITNYSAQNLKYFGQN